MPKKTDPFSKYLRYRKGLWIPQRKRSYLYWFKYLQEAEVSPDYEVKWNKYRGWGGSNAILGMKFDEWWNEKWEELFSLTSTQVPLNKQKYPMTTTRIKTEAIRLSLLIYQFRDTPPDMTPRVEKGGVFRSTARRGGRNIAIARKVIAYETGKMGKKRRKDTPLWQIDPDEYGEQIIQSRVGRYMKRAKSILSNVTEGQFP